MKLTDVEIATYERGDEEADRVAIVLPGRLDTKDYVHMTSLVDYLADLGFYALSFDPPGTWESSGDISTYSTTSILDVTDEIIHRLGSKPTVLLGHSRGGTHALLSGAMNPAVTHMVAIMSSSGPTNYGIPKKGSTKHSTRDLPPGTGRTVGRRTFELPYAYFEDQATYDALPALKTSSKPKLFVYGTQDTLVRPETVVAIYDASAAPKVLRAIDTEHDYRLHPDAIKQVNTVVGKFLKDYEAI